MGALEKQLRAVRDGGAKVFVPYVTGGLPGVDAELLRGLEAAGADAIEVGIPHSDPIMDGGVIQEASRIALERGTRPHDVLRAVRDAALGVPVAVMTYVNPVYRRGFDAFCDELREAGISGAIVPDLPVDEAGAFGAAAGARGIDVVLLAAPGASAERLGAIATRARGFVYCVATYGVTGARGDLSATARDLVEELRPRTDLPLLVGVGIGTPEQAAEACAFADGVIVGSALVGRLLDDGSGAALDLARSFRATIGGG
jgi:tryptophan synthase alpha chain